MLWVVPGVHKKEGMGRDKEYETPMHLIEISEPTHAVHVTENRQNREVCSQEKYMY